MIKAIAPGKLILSGEHAVVHGQPALAMAINRFSEAVIFPQADGRVFFDALGLQSSDSLTWMALRKLKRRLQCDYERFLQGKLSIRDVLKKPIQLTQFAITHLLETLHDQQRGGFRVQTRSTIPIGCGMGSSAATILSVIYAFGHYLKLNWERQHYYKEALSIENLQHGRSSGLDLNVSLQGGLIWYRQDQYEARPIPKNHWYIVNTGTPLSSTGECVVHTSNRLKKDHILLDDFGFITSALDQAIQVNNFIEMQRAIRLNHRLLCQLGIVPQRIQDFILALERKNVAAKICGAGSLMGHKAGVLLLLSEKNPISYCEAFGYSCTQIQSEQHGLRII